MEMIPSRLITPTQLALFSRSPVIGAWWEELKAQKLFRDQLPATKALDELLLEQGHQHEVVLIAKLTWQLQLGFVSNKGREERRHRLALGG